MIKKVLDTLKSNSSFIIIFQNESNFFYLIRNLLAIKLEI